MNLKKIIPYAIAGYVILVGVFFGISTLFNGVFVDPEPPGSYFLRIISKLVGVKKRENKDLI